MSNIQQRAREAQTLLSEQSVLSAALAKIRQEAIDAFLSSRGDPEAMAAAYHKVNAAEALETAIRSFVNAGAVEQHKEKRQ